MADKFFVKQPEHVTMHVPGPEGTGQVASSSVAPPVHVQPSTPQMQPSSAYAQPTNPHVQSAVSATQPHESVAAEQSTMGGQVPVGGQSMPQAPAQPIRRIVYSQGNPAGGGDASGQALPDDYFVNRNYSYDENLKPPGKQDIGGNVAKIIFFVIFGIIAINVLIGFISVSTDFRNPSFGGSNDITFFEAVPFSEIEGAEGEIQWEETPHFQTDVGDALSSSFGAEGLVNIADMNPYGDLDNDSLEVFAQLYEKYTAESQISVRAADVLVASTLFQTYPNEMELNDFYESITQDSMSFEVQDTGQLDDALTLIENGDLFDGVSNEEFSTLISSGLLDAKISEDYTYLFDSGPVNTDSRQWQVLASLLAVNLVDQVNNNKIDLW